MKLLIVGVTVLVHVAGFPSAIAAGTIAGEGYTNAQCAECHEEMADDHGASGHKDTPCLECHIQAAEEDHEAVAPVDCGQCHAPHDEKIAHDAHIRVSCKACHVNGGVPATDTEGQTVIWSGAFQPGMAWLPHQAVKSETDPGCASCHFTGNTFGASSMILPAKSILCMPCHVATFSMGDKTTIISLILFLAGILSLGAVWFSGSISGGASRFGEASEVTTRSAPRAPFSHNFFTLIIAEVLFLRRLFRLSPVRWVIHALIFFPFLFRFAFGLTALVLSIYLPDASTTRAMLDKNFAPRAFLFDVTGLMILAGAAAAIFRSRNEQIATIPFLPEPGRGMTVLLGLIVLLGFVLEGLRMAMTGWPDGAEWAFFGYGVSLMVKGMVGLTDIYGYVWYTHAIMVGASVALIPFTRMSHIITAPIALILNARSENKVVS